MTGSRRAPLARRAAAGLAGLAAVAVLALTGLAAIAARGGSYATELPRGTAPPGPPTGPPKITLPAYVTAAGGPRPAAEFADPVVGTVLFWLLVALAAAALAAGGWLAVRHRPRRRPAEAALRTTSPADAVTALPAAVEQALVAVEQPDAREAVVQAWLVLGAAAAAAGTPARPAETAAEYGERLAAAHGLPVDAVSRLAALYREARFSGHPVLPQQRDAARAELTSLRSALRARTSTR